MGWRERVGMKVMGWDGLLCPSDSAQNTGDSQGNSTLLDMERQSDSTHHSSFFI